MASSFDPECSVQPAARKQRAKLGNERTRHGALQVYADLTRGAFCGFERDITREAFHHDDVDRTLTNLVALDEALVFQRHIGRRFE